MNSSTTTSIASAKRFCSQPAAAAHVVDRQNAVSSAPQNEEPIQTLATSATTPKPVDESRTRSSALRERVVGGGGEQLLQVLEHALLEVAALQHPARR